MLEEELGVKLFVRGAKNTTLTEAGKALYIRAGSLLTMAGRYYKKRSNQGK